MRKNKCIALVMLFFLVQSCDNIKTKQQPKSGEISQDKQEVKANEMVNDYAATGKLIATETQSVLATNLIAALKQGGPVYALQFCNLQAYPLTDSMAKKFNAGIRRVTDKARNPENQANVGELEYIKALKGIMATGQKPASKMTELNGKMTGYYPIVTNNMCLQCHGRKEVEIVPATLKKIHQLYPADKATGYKENELRGLWVVELIRK